MVTEIGDIIVFFLQVVSLCIVNIRNIEKNVKKKFAKTNGTNKNCISLST